MPVRMIISLVAAFAIVAAACGDAGTESTEPDAQALPPAAGACLAGDPDCQDLGPLPVAGEEPPILPGEPDPGAPEPVPSDLDDGPVTPLAGGGLSVGDVLANDIDGGFAVQAFYVADATGRYLCDALAESFPPQCGGDRIPFDNTAGADLGLLQSEGGVTWSNDLVVVVGEIVDGTFVAIPFAE